MFVLSQSHARTSDHKNHRQSMGFQGSRTNFDSCFVAGYTLCLFQEFEELLFLLIEGHIQYMVMFIYNICFTLALKNPIGGVVN